MLQVGDVYTKDDNDIEIGWRLVYRASDRAYYQLDYRSGDIQKIRTVLPLDVYYRSCDGGAFVKRRPVGHFQKITYSPAEIKRALDGWNSYKAGLFDGEYKMLGIVYERPSSVLRKGGVSNQGWRTSVNRFESFSRESEQISVYSIMRAFAYTVSWSRCRLCGCATDGVEYLDTHGRRLCGACWRRNYVSCNQCSKTVSKRWGYKISGMHYCKDCYESFPVCDHCGKHESAYRLHSVKAVEGGAVVEKQWCDRCRSNRSLVRRCEYCLDHKVVELFHDNNYCRDCYSRFEACEFCGEKHPSLYTVYNVNGIGERITQKACWRCVSSRARRCQGCERWFMDHDMQGGDVFYRGSNQYFCERCRENANPEYCEDCETDYIGSCRCSSEVRVHDYGYKPTPRFWSCAGENTKRYYGVEIETECRGYRDLGLRLFGKLKMADHVYPKYDGSLDSGIEWVTHPATFNSWHDITSVDAMGYKVAGLVDGLRKIGFRAHDTNTCGLHVHVSRAGVSDIALRRLSILVYRHYNAVCKRVARRDMSNRWSKNKDTGGSVDQLVRQTGDRYEAINLCCRNTIEFRFPKGTLIFSTILAVIELIEAMINYVEMDGVTVNGLSEQDYDAREFWDYVSVHGEYSNLLRFSPYDNSTVNNSESIQ